MVEPKKFSLFRQRIVESTLKEDDDLLLDWSRPVGLGFRVSGLGFRV